MMIGRSNCRYFAILQGLRDCVVTSRRQSSPTTITTTTITMKTITTRTSPPPLPTPLPPLPNYPKQPPPLRPVVITTPTTLRIATTTLHSQTLRR